MTAILRYYNGKRRNPTVEAWLKEPRNELRDLAHPWYLKLRACGADVQELMHDGCPTVCVQDAPFAYVNIFKAHANVGFFYGAELKDPAKLLEGTGKRMRHVKLKPGTTVDTKALAALVDASYLHIKDLLKTL